MLSFSKVHSYLLQFFENQARETEGCKLMAASLMYTAEIQYNSVPCTNENQAEGAFAC